MSAAWIRRLARSAELGAARDALRRDGHVALSGLSGAARGLVPLLLDARPLLVVVSAEREVESLASDLRTLLLEAGESGLALPFPAPGPPPFRGLPRHPEAALRRATALHTAARGRLRAVVASPSGLLRPVLTRDLLETRAFALRVGEEMTPEILVEALDEAGYQFEDPVTGPGQVARRGGILDVFPPSLAEPVRIEFLGDTVESLRSFDPETQRTTRRLEEVEVLPLADIFATRSIAARLHDILPERFPDRRELPGLLERLDRGLAEEEVADLVGLVPGVTVPAWQHFEGALTVVVEPEAVREEAHAYHDKAQSDRERHPESMLLRVEELLIAESVLLERLLVPDRIEVRQVALEDGSLPISCRPARRYAGDLRSLVADLAAAEGCRVLLLGNAGRADRVRDVLKQDALPLGEETVDVRVGTLSHGFELPGAGLVVLSDGDVFPEEVHLQSKGRKGVRSFLSDFRDLKIGDLVVHDEHGIGRFQGLEVLDVAGFRKEFMVLAYQGGDKLKVPVEAFDRIQKYGSVENARPNIDKLGSGNWDKVKKRVKKAMRDMAAELLKLYAERKARPGHPFLADSPWQHEFEDAFEYDETRDQANAIAEVASDMASPTPMDRLVCGDVGYGKTEVAMRAAMRAVVDGKQVAVLSPTTVLAFQHWKTFRKRFAPFPVTVEMVSRFRSAKEVKHALGGLAQGKVDILIGTHRLLSKDVAFKDLGLLVIDEEQRFGVAAKERLKHLRTTIDCLTLSATPIPRTLQMGLSGLRDMSVIETPPKDRLAIQTSIVKFSTEAIATAVRQELARDGQVYFVHNRVESIYSVANMVQKLVPEARVVVGHGQMPEGELEKAMLAFVEGRADVLCATTIIENGLDIPRANTLIVNRADRYGLAQLYQLRGRVGRSDRRAFALLLVPPDKVLSEIARKRLAAIREFSELGAGFRIAALDLELRGAGNLLGGQQSGHIEAIGLDLYIKLLEQTILELKGEAPRSELRAQLNLKVDLRIPEDYVPDVHQRIALYKRASQVADLAEIDPLRAEIRDRYGAPPPEVDTLLAYAALRLRAERLGIAQADLSVQAVHLRFQAEGPVRPERVLDLVSATSGATLSPQGVLRVPLRPAEHGPGALAALLDRLEAPA